MMRKFLIVLLCICTLFLCFVIPSFADDSITPLATVPTDLTGYTVTVPSGWSVSSDSGIYNLIIGNNYYLRLGFTVADNGFAINFTPQADTLVISSQFDIPIEGRYDIYESIDSFTFTITGGNDVDNEDLIYWLVDNNATFTSSDPEPDLNPDVILSAGDYYLNLSIGYLPISEWFDDGYSYGYNSGGYYYVGTLPYYFTWFYLDFKSISDDNNYHLMFNVYTDSEQFVTLYDIYCVNGRYTVDSLDGLTYFSFEEDVDIDLYARNTFEYFFKTYAPDTPVFDGNPWSYILEMVIEALKVKIWGYFSVWDIVTTLCGIFIATWLLKLLAGG